MANWQNGVTSLNENNMNALYDLRQGGTFIAANTDLDNLTTPGTYRCDNSTVTPTLVNCPVTSGYFKMTVEAIHSSTRIRQIIYISTGTSNVYVRTYTGSWGDWKKMLYIDDVLGLGTKISSGTDINSLTTPGIYYSESAAKSATLINAPVTTAGFKLIVEYVNSNIRYNQIAIINDSKAAIYTRTFSSTEVWSDWEMLQTNKIDTGTLTYNTTYVVGTPDQYHYCRSGNVVQISFRAQLANSIPNGTTLITLPWKSLIQSEVMAYKGTRYTRTDTFFAFVSSNNNTLAVATWSETDKYIHIAFTYITNE